MKAWIGGSLLFLLNKHFPKGSELHKLFNKNNLKILYSCLPSYDAILKGINTNKINATKTRANGSKACNSEGVRNKGCIGKEMCEEISVVYEATVHLNENGIYKRTYVGMTDGKLKYQIRKHYIGFKYKRYRNSTPLSGFIWKLQESKSTFQIEWDIVESKPAYKKGQKLCRLCVWEKKWIERLDGQESLNLNKEFMSKCPHKWKFAWKWLARITDVENVELLRHTMQPNFDTLKTISFLFLKFSKIYVFQNLNFFEALNFLG